MIPWLMAFVFTQMVEAPIYLRAQRLHGPSRSTLARVAIALGASAITHPPLWAFSSRAWVWLYLSVIERFPQARVESPIARYVIYVLLAEGVVWLVEGLYLHALRVRYAWRWALVANAASVLLGFGSRAIFGVP